MKKDKVLHIINISFTINHFFGKQFLYLKEKTGNEYHLGCTPSNDFLMLSKELEFIPFEVEITREISLIKDLKAIFRTYKYIKQNRITVVIGHTPKGGIIAMLAAKLAGISKRVYFRHGLVYETGTSINKLLLKMTEKLSGFLASKVVCVSNSVKIISENHRLNDPQKNIVLGLGTCNGIDTENKFNPDMFNPSDFKNLMNKYNISINDKIVGYVGRMVKDKGIDDLIIAWDIIKLKYSNAKLMLVGPIEERDSISNYSKSQIDLDSSIVFIDYVIDASLYYKLMDVFVLPTYREGFPTVSLEASSMSLPVIITKATGCTEAILENQTGLFISHDPKDIAKKIFFYLENEKVAKEHGKNGRMFVQENFEQTKIWDRIAVQL